MSTERSSVGFGSVRIRAPYIPSHNGPVEMDSNISLYRDEAMFEVILKFSLENNEFPQVKSPLSLHREEAIRLRIKRSTLRTIVIKRQSKSFLRYEMFKRLNTGGSLLAPQEIRNCSARMLGDDGTKFYGFLKELSEHESFTSVTQTLAQEDYEKKANEELVLRFFAAKNAINAFKGSVRDWLDDYMEGILLGKIVFDYNQERKSFVSVFGAISDKLGENAFVKFRNNQPIGGLAPAYFEAIAIACQRKIVTLKRTDKSLIKASFISLVQSDEFRGVTGPGANAKSKLQQRINLAVKAIVSA